MFRLVRFFSITSLVAFIIVTAVLVMVSRQAAIDDLVALGESKNIALTQAFANSLWHRFEPLIEEAPDLSTQALQSHPLQPQLREQVHAQMEGLSVAKVKVYDLRGMTIFSTEQPQIGEDKSTNAGFLTALNGQIATELVHRDTFSAFEGTIEDRDLISSYIPIRLGGPDGEVVGVMEVYDDVTPLLQRIEERQRSLGAAVVGTLVALYAALFFIVKRGENLIKEQQAELVASESRLSAVLNTVHEGIITVAPSGAIVMHNQEAPSVWGYESTELRAVNLRQLIGGREASQVMAELADFDRRGGSDIVGAEIEVEGRRKDGSSFPLALRISVTELREGRVFTAAVQDITGRKRAADALSSHNRQLERANHLFRRTIEQMTNLIENGANHLEMLTYLQLAEREFERRESANLN